MFKNVLIAGILGGLTLIIWIFVINGIFGFQAKIEMKRIPAESQVYKVLKEHIVDPGCYVINPELTPENAFPGEAPVYSVLYGGVGHEAAGRLMLVQIMVGFFAVIIGTWMLSQTSNHLLSSYPRKVMFFSAIGLILAVFTDLTKFGIGGYPLNDAIFFGTNSLISWTLVGLVVAWRMKPTEANSSKT